MDQGLRHNPLHIICCFRKLPGSLSLSGSACPSDDVEPWRGCAGWGVVGLQGGSSNLAWHSAWGLWEHPASPGKPVFQDSMAVKKGIGCKGAGGAGVRTEGWFLLLQSWEGTRLLFFLSVMRWKDADSALSTRDDASFLKLWNTIYKKRTTFQEPLISSRMYFFFFPGGLRNLFSVKL